MDALVRQRVWERSQGFCELCGCGLGPGEWDFHHRKARKHGGQDSVENGLALCHVPCHLITVHQYPQKARESGWIVRRGNDPLLQPVLVRGLRVFLGSDGAYKKDVHNTSVMIEERVRF